MTMATGEMQIRPLRSNASTTWLLVLRDVLVVLVATGVAFLLRFEFRIPEAYAPSVLPTALVASVLFPALFHASGLYGYLWRYLGVDSFVRLGVVTWAGVTFMAFAVAVFESAAHVRPLPYSVVALLGVLGYVGFSGGRAASRVLAHARSLVQTGNERVLIVGAGDAGSLLLQDIESNPGLGLHVAGFLDDDPDKLGRRMRTVPVIGPTSSLAEAIEQEHADTVFVAIPSAEPHVLRQILYGCGKAKVKVRVVPALALQRHSVKLVDLETVDFDRFLGREPVHVDLEAVRGSIEGGTVLVTGAAGSIGSELCRQVLRLRPARLVLLELDESRLYETFLELAETAQGVAIEMALGDVRSLPKLRRIFGRYDVDLVIHAAAYKHVPLMELEPDEAVRTNVMGTRNLLQVCEERHIARFLLISTDKAVTPTSVMGLSKAIAERLSFESAARGMHVTVVRFGNVLGSRGSVVPLFRQRLERGEPVTITDPDVDRYFMTIPEAAQLVLQAQGMSAGCDLYILDMGEPVRILDLACAIIGQQGGDADVRFPGLRPAEKLHEELVHADACLLPTACAKVMRSDAVPSAADGFSQLVPQLIEAAESDDRSRMQQLMVQLCPDFAGAVATAGGAS